MKLRLSFASRCAVQSGAIHCRGAGSRVASFACIRQNFLASSISWI
jgi:hypothetical protein